MLHKWSFPGHKRRGRNSSSGPATNKADQESNRQRLAPKEPLRPSGKIHAGSSARYHKSTDGVSPYMQPKKRVVIHRKRFTHVEVAGAPPPRMGS